MVVAQLAEQCLPTPEIHGSNPNIGNISNVFICQLLSRKDENKVKEAENGQFKKNLGGSIQSYVVRQNFQSW